MDNVLIFPFCDSSIFLIDLMEITPLAACRAGIKTLITDVLRLLQSPDWNVWPGPCRCDRSGTGA